MSLQAKPIDFGEQDGTVVVGMTRSGKTYGVMRSLMQQERPVLFYNTNQSPFPAGWTHADMGTDTADLLDGLIAGERIVYNPSREYRQQELALLIAWLFQAAETGGEMDIYVAVDECHLYNGKALAACLELATTGIRWGLKPIWISQRPAMINNTLITQATRFVIYDLSQAEVRWLKEYRMPYEDIFGRLRAAQPDPTKRAYAYVVYDGRTVEGGYRVP